MPHGDNYIRFKDIASGNFGDLALIISSEHWNAPLLTWSAGMIVKKDFSAGGYVSANQGLIALGSGMKDQFDPPGAWMIHSNTHALHDLRTLSSPPSIPSGKKPHYINSSNNHVYGWNGSTWVDRGHKDKYNYYFDTFYIRKANYSVQTPINDAGRPIADSDLAHLACYNIDAAGLIHGGGSSGDAFLVGDDLYIVDVNQANTMSLQGAQDRYQARIQFGKNGVLLYKDGTFLRCDGGFVTNGTVSVGTYATGGSGSAVYFNSVHQLCYGTSLREYKTNIKPLEDASWIYNLRPVTFDWKDEKETRAFGKQIGLIAEEVQPQAPLLTFTNDQTGKLQGVLYEKLAVPMLVELQKLRKEVNELKTKLAATQTTSTNDLQIAP
jgi:hypothetical protein